MEEIGKELTAEQQRELDIVQKAVKEVEFAEIPETPAPARAMKGLTSGRIVHYVSEDGAHRPAMITKVIAQGGYVKLVQILDNSPEDFGELKNRDAFYSEGKEPGTWHWIEEA